jgi:hypothetical protein
MYIFIFCYEHIKKINTQRARKKVYISNNNKLRKKFPPFIFVPFTNEEGKK